MKNVSVKMGMWGRLIIPLTLVFAVSLLIHFLWPADGFFINLSTEIIGIAITVFYVDWILEQHEKQTWLLADERIADRIERTMISTLTAIRIGLGFNADILNESAMISTNPAEIHNEIARIADQVLSPVTPQRVTGLDKIGWERLRKQIVASRNEVLTLQMTFQARLNPQKLATLLDLEEALARSMHLYETFSDVIGIPYPDLPPSTNIHPEILQKVVCDSTAAELRKALMLIKQMSTLVIQDNWGTLKRPFDTD